MAREQILATLVPRHFGTQISDKFNEILIAELHKFNPPGRDQVETISQINDGTHYVGFLNRIRPCLVTLGEFPGPR